MVAKKQPNGAELEKLVEQWYSTDHEGKVQLAKEFKVSYGTMKHWLSDLGLTRKQVRTDIPTMTVTAPELLAVSPSVELDFVMFDLETSGFDADWDILLTAAIKPYGKEPITFRADNYPEWTTNRADDRGITIDIASELRKHAIVIGHYSERFDVRFIRAKMFRHGLEPLPPMFGLDTWRIAKNNFKVSNRRMKSLSIFARIPLPKEEPDGDRWMRAAFGGEKEALDKILAHNIDDVLILERLACISFPYVKSIPRL